MSDWPQSTLYQTFDGELLDLTSPFSIPAGANIYVNAVAGPSSPFILLLPPATGSGFRELIRKADNSGFNIEIVAYGTDTINGDPIWYLTAQFTALGFLDQAPGVWVVA